ncbi:hypothetical protein [Nordella sp. HKS 07]|nr:hypothetical protein [Nordella sp. HKS 07]
MALAGGGVERRETTYDAASRELAGEGGIILGERLRGLICSAL